MAGIYIHIPFCSQACSYCDFHFSTSMKKKGEVLQAIREELIIRKDYLEGEKVETIYFGGGTPSILTPTEVKGLLDVVFSNYSMDENVEITLEANPENLSKDYLKKLSTTTINRLSIGIQSFRDKDLGLMNRIHTGKEALAAVKESQNSGFENITIDLIYAIPGLEKKDWQKNIEQAIQLQVPHISAYCLTVEPKTALHYQVKKKIVPEVPGDKAAEDFLMLTDMLNQEEYMHYEISNFGKPGFLSRHNTAYWKGKKYLGIGPSAHSFNGASRQWNVASNIKYLQSIAKKELLFEYEEIDKETGFNEYVLTSVRTMWGCDLEHVKKVFGSHYKEHLKKEAEPYLVRDMMVKFENKLVLTRNGKLMADKIASDLFI